MTSRVLPASEVPANLWCESILKIPSSISDAYVNRIADQGLDELAKDVRDNRSGEIGGEDYDSSNRHFCAMFPNSLARTQFCCLDPTESLELISDAIILGFTTGKVAIIDLPSGSGAGVWGILSTIAELRIQNLLPPLPLSIKVVSADYSQASHEHNLAIYQKMKPAFATAGIEVSLNCINWDAGDARNTAALMDQAIPIVRDSDRILLTVTNFSGELSSNEDLSERFRENFTQIISRIPNLPHIVLWVEPRNSKTKKKFFPAVIGNLIKAAKWLRLGSGIDPKKPFSEAEYTVTDPWNGVNFGTGLVVSRMDSEGWPWK